MPRARAFRVVAPLLVLVCLALQPAGAGARLSSAPTARQDTATASGATAPPPPGLGSLTDIHIDASSGPVGEAPSGSVSFDVWINRITHIEPFPLDISGPVTCLNVFSPNAALINADTSYGIVTVELVDNGGGGLDSLSFGSGNAAGDCATFPSGEFEFDYDRVLGAGRATVFDAKPYPTSKERCKRGGWRSFGFPNQGRCICFVLNGPRAPRAPTPEPPPRSPS